MVMRIQRNISNFKRFSDSIPSLKDKFGDSGVIIIDDKASCNKIQWVQKKFSGNNVPQMEWPPYSADINFIENIWYILKNKVFKVYSKSIQKLRLNTKNMAAIYPYKCKDLVK